jgi:hypothetical protein
LVILRNFTLVMTADGRFSEARFARIVLQRPLQKPALNSTTLN